MSGSRAEPSKQCSLQHFRQHVHESKLYTSFYGMLKDENLVDAIVSCDGVNIKAHRLVLSANSSYFKSLFDAIASPCQIPVIVLNDVTAADLRAIIEFMYKGEVSVDERQLPSMLKSAELLKVCGLTELGLTLSARIAGEKSTERTERGVAKVSPSTAVPKRPRITEGLAETPKRARLNEGLSETVGSPLLSPSLSESLRKNPIRIDIRHLNSATTSSSPPSQPNQRPAAKPQTAPQSTPQATSPNVPTFVRNVILPASQLHKSQSPPTAQKSTVAQNIITSNNAITTTASSNNQIPKSSQSFSQSNQSRIAIKPAINPIKPMNITSLPTPKPSNKQTLPVLKPIISSKTASSNTWTPSPRPTLSSRDPPSAEKIAPNVRTIELIIDDDPPESTESNDDDIIEVDVKPPIFDLCEIESKNSTTAVDLPDNPSELSIIDDTTKTTAVKTTPAGQAKETGDFKTKEETRVRSRSQSSGSQSLPPPPSYRVVQRSTARLLRNIIRPAATQSSTAAKAKEGDESAAAKAKLKKLRKDRQCVGVINSKRHYPNSVTADSGGGGGDCASITLEPSCSVTEATPEIECPSCGEVFHDETNWNDHIANVHLPFQT